MPSAVDICNRALTRLGDARITSLTDDNKAARACAAAFVMVRDEVYRSHPWTHVTKRVTLSKDGTPDWGYSAYFEKPVDCVRVIEVLDEKDWRIEGSRILVDADTIYIRYLFKQDDYDKLDPLLVSAIASRLKAELAEELTQSNSKVQTAWQEYNQVLAVAKMVNAQEGTLSTFVEDDWITERY